MCNVTLYITTHYKCQYLSARMFGCNSTGPIVIFTSILHNGKIFLLLNISSKPTLLHHWKINNLIACYHDPYCTTISDTEPLQMSYLYHRVFSITNQMIKLNPHLFVHFQFPCLFLATSTEENSLYHILIFTNLNTKVVKPSRLCVCLCFLPLWQQFIMCGKLCSQEFMLAF